MVTLIDALFAVIIVAGVVLSALGYIIYRRWEQLGAPALAAFAVILGLGSALSGVVGLFIGPSLDRLAMPEWGQFVLLAWALASVPWLTFSLQYTGRYTRIGWQTIGVLYIPLPGFVLSVFHTATDIGSVGIVNAVSSIIFIYCFALVFLGAFVLIQSTYSYTHLSLGQCIGLATTPIIVVIAGNSIGALQDAPHLLIVGQYTAALVFGVAAFGAVTVRDSLLDWTPAVETIGERAITRETDDLICIVDEEENVVECNATAAETLSVSPVPGERLSESLGVLSLRDVTDRELREQRLAVLNRILRHNLRNKVDVVKSHAEMLDGTHDNGHVTEIVKTVDEITELGYQARTIDRFVSESRDTQHVDLVAIIDQLWTSMELENSTVSITTSLPDTTTVETNRQALEGALEIAVDKAVTYAASAVDLVVERRGDEYEIVVADDGPGITDQSNH